MFGSLVRNRRWHCKRNSNNMKFIKFILSLLIALAIVGSLMFGIMHLTKKAHLQEIKELRSKAKYTIGKVTRQGNMKGNYAVLEYKINGKKHTTKQNCGTNDIEEGEYFKIMYDSTDIYNCYVLFEDPIFLNTEYVSTYCGKIIYVQDGYSVRIEFYVNNTRYTRSQNIYPDDTFFKLGRMYNVRYKVSNPNIAIIDRVSCD